MALPIIYFAGGEDSEFAPSGAAAVVTTAGAFRSTFSRCALRSTAQTEIWTSRNTVAFPATFWMTVILDPDLAAITGAPSAAAFLSIVDGNNASINRIFFRGNTGGGQPTGGLLSTQLCKQNAAGTITQLGSNFILPCPENVHQTCKLDLFVDYGASGTIILYQNGTPLITFTGDTTTDGLTDLSGCRIKFGAPDSLNLSTSFNWSECIVSDSDTRSFNLQTLAPVANGNTHNFDTGAPSSPAASQVNETTLSDLTFDGATTAGLIDQYTVPAIAATNLGVIAIGVSARAAMGYSGPTKADLGVRVSGADYWSADQSLLSSLADYQIWWSDSPATPGTAWTGLPTNIGVKAVA